MSKMLRIILPLHLFTLISNTTFATVSNEGKELKEITYSARKLGFSKDGLSNFISIIKSQTGAISFGGDVSKVMGKIKYPKLWSLGKHKNSVKNAFGHYKKHGKEFPDINNAVEYVEKAHGFMRTPPAGTLSKVRANGEKVFYNPATETFAIRAKDGAPKTIFIPDPAKHGYPTNLDYYNAQ